ncbi:MAG TPA: carbohydrate porin [Stellaceae bacterium]|nr:carbohydrate porin [Stellaceae bacterium]
MSVTTAAAAPPPLLVPGGAESLQPTPGGGFEPFGFLTGIQKSGNLLGDMWGLRPLLYRYGISLAVSETSEVLGNVTGGVRQGFEYDGLTQMAVQLDTQQAFGWYGGTFRASALQVHGRNLSTDNLLSLQTASGIEADDGARLWELWYQQKFLNEDRADVKIGQMSLDQEFIVSQNALVFVNTMFGWPLVPSDDLPGGGPAYPLSALGVRLRVRPTDSLTGLLAVTNGNPAPNNLGDPQVENPSGTSFPLNGGALVIGELQYAYPALGAMVATGQGEVHPGTIKVGFWYNSEAFDDLEFDNTGLSLANPASTGLPLQHHGDYSLYGVIDQVVGQTPAGGTLNFFTRVMGTPQGDRNPIIFALNTGLTLHGPFASRDNDTAGVAVEYGRVSGSQAALDQQTASFTGSFVPVQTGETVIELTYQYQLAPAVQLQPDFQYTFNPGGGILNPNMPTETIKNEAVLGVRVNLTF